MSAKKVGSHSRTFLCHFSDKTDTSFPTSSYLFLFQGNSSNILCSRIFFQSFVMLSPFSTKYCMGWDTSYLWGSPVINLKNSTLLSTFWRLRSLSMVYSFRSLIGTKSRLLATAAAMFSACSTYGIVREICVIKWTSIWPGRFTISLSLPTDFVAMKRPDLFAPSLRFS